MPNTTTVSASALMDEGHFRIVQIDEVFTSALKLQKDCFDQLARDGAMTGASIRDYLNSAQIVTTAMELGGIYRPPGKDDDFVCIGTSGYGVRQLPNRRSFKYSAYSERDIRDLVSESHSQMSTCTSSNQAEVDILLEQIKTSAQFSETEVLADWFKRHQAQGVYKERYKLAYRVYEIKVDDYQDELSRVKQWLDHLQSEWQLFKKLRPVEPFVERQLIRSS